MSTTIAAVVTTYCPDMARLTRVLAALRQQVPHIVIVDDQSPGGKARALRKLADSAGAYLRRQPSNLGQAAALNLGIAIARQRWLCRDVLLLDQDSILHPNAVSRLIQALKSSENAAAVGTLAVDAGGVPLASFWRVGPWRRTAAPTAASTVPCDFLMTSGCLLRVATIDQIGAFDESLFIDNVDLEWSFRARSRGWTLLGVPAARLEHEIGSTRNVAGIGRVTQHSADRHYYMTRNRIHLYLQSSTPNGWILSDIPRLLGKIGLVAVSSPRRLLDLSAMAEGAADAIRKRSGRRRETS